jgi:hypothetical protein
VIFRQLYYSSDRFIVPNNESMSLQLDMAEHERRLVSTLTKPSGVPLSGSSGTDVSGMLPRL